MSSALHISQARALLDAGQPVDLVVVKVRDGSLMHLNNVVSLRYHFYKGTRTIKLLASHRLIPIHDVCILRINDFDVFL